MPRCFWHYKASRLLYDRKKMKKIIILIPVYNDWESLNKLLGKINENIQFFNKINFEFYIYFIFISRNKLFLYFYMYFIYHKSLQDN